MRETNDGFRIAEEDLRLRGPGEILGTRQSGEEAFRVATPETGRRTRADRAERRPAPARPRRRPRRPARAGGADLPLPVRARPGGRADQERLITASGMHRNAAAPLPCRGGRTRDPIEPDRSDMRQDEPGLAVHRIIVDPQTLHCGESRQLFGYDEGPATCRQRTRLARSASSRSPSRSIEGTPRRRRETGTSWRGAYGSRHQRPSRRRGQVSPRSGSGAKSCRSAAAAETIATFDSIANIVETRIDAVVDCDPHIGLWSIAGAEFVAHFGIRDRDLVAPIDDWTACSANRAVRTPSTMMPHSLSSSRQFGPASACALPSADAPKSGYRTSSACLFLPRLSFTGSSSGTSDQRRDRSRSHHRAAPRPRRSCAWLPCSRREAESRSAHATMLIPPPTESVGRVFAGAAARRTSRAPSARPPAAAARPWSIAVASVASTIFAWLISAPGRLSSRAISSSGRSVNSLRNAPTSASCVFRQNCQ